ncbi:MAG: hypothetical protein AB1714_00825 [Acidobacteriota bacterium]
MRSIAARGRSVDRRSLIPVSAFALVCVLPVPAPPGADSVAAPSLWPNACKDGRIDLVIDGFEKPAVWSFCCSDEGVPPPKLTSSAGCSGKSMAVRYDLDDGDWLVIYRSFPHDSPLDLTGYDHLRLSFKNSTTDTHHNLQIKLKDGSGRLYWISAESVLDLRVWRPMYVDLREFQCFGESSVCEKAPPLDTSSITEIQLAIARCIRDGKECEPGSDSGILYLDELAAVDLRPGSKHRLVETSFEPVIANPDLRGSTAKAILRQQDADNGLVPAWFDTNDPAYPNYNTYSEALALLVFVDEYGRTGDTAFRDAANDLADELLRLQISGKKNAGAWFTGYTLDEEKQVVPVDSSCTGNETQTGDIDRCQWIGNTAWCVVALDRLRDAKMHPSPASLNKAIIKAGSWMVRQVGRVKDYPKLVTQGLEGNISTYFGLIAAGRDADARRLSQSILNYGWDSVLKRMKIGAGPNDFGTAMDTAGSWGVELLRLAGREADALSSQGFAATLLRTQSFDKNNPARRIVYGYGDIAGPWTVSVEASAQAAAAGILGANYVLRQLYPLQRSDGSFPSGCDNWYGGTVAPWTTTMPGVSPTAWIYLAQNGNPLLWHLQTTGSAGAAISHGVQGTRPVMTLIGRGE